MGFDPVEGGEEGCHSLLVCFLGRRETGLVDPIVDVVVGPVVGGVDLASESGRVQVDVPVFFRKKIIEFVVEHANDLRALFKCSNQ